MISGLIRAIASMDRMNPMSSAVDMDEVDGFGVTSGNGLGVIFGSAVIVDLVTSVVLVEVEVFILVGLLMVLYYLTIFTILLSK